MLINLDVRLLTEMFEVRTCSIASNAISSPSRQNTTKAFLSLVSPMDTVALLLVEFPRGQILSVPPLSNQMHLMRASFSIFSTVGVKHCIFLFAEGCAKMFHDTLRIR